MNPNLRKLIIPAVVLGVALIAVAIIGAVFLLGGRINNTYTCVGNSMPTGSSASPSASC